MHGVLLGCCECAEGMDSEATCWQEAWWACREAVERLCECRGMSAEIPYLQRTCSALGTGMALAQTPSCSTPWPSWGFQMAV